MNEASGGKLAARVKEELETLRKCEILLDQVYRCLSLYVRVQVNLEYGEVLIFVEHL